MKKTPLFLATLFILSALSFALDIRLAWIFTDHAVLQRDLAVPVWGTTSPDMAVTAEINGVSAGSRSSRTGEFIIRLPKLPAGGPYVLTVKATDAKTNETAQVSCQDIMVGDVWLAGGQSNMQYQLNSDWSKDSALPMDQKAHKTNIVQLNEYLDNCTPETTIRGITVPRVTSYTQEEEVNAVWNVMDKEHAGALCAVGAWFGREIQGQTGIPVGIIACNWGGTRAEVWMSRSALLNDPNTAQLIADKDEVFYNVEEAETTEQMAKLKYIQANNLQDPGNKGADQGWANADFDDSKWVDYQIPGSWMEQKIMGNGALWARSIVRLPEAWMGKELILHLGGIDKHDVTYANGVEVGRTGKDLEEQHWNIPRKYVIPANVNNSETLTIAVRAFSFLFDGSFNGDESLYALELKETGKKIPLAGTWKARPEVDLGGPFRFILPRRYVGTNYHTPGILFDSMLRPIMPYGIRGAIWYQGESNAGKQEDSLAYRSILGTMIKDWRYLWGQGDFPFIQVQLAAYTKAMPYCDKHAWPYLREAQVKVCEDLPNVYMATAIDLGDAEDIHPQNKKDVGRRLACAALHYVYGNDHVVPFGPLYKDATIEGDAIRLSFDNAQGLKFKGEKAQGFYIAGKDMKFIPADEVQIQGETILVKASSIAEPAFVRYSWSNNPDGNLYNGADLPASSFRTDE